MPAQPGTAEVFISYASADRPRVGQIAEHLARAGASFWFDQDAIEGSAEWAAEIVKGIKGCKLVLLMVSDASMRSWAVKQEIQIAGEQQKAFLPLILEKTSYPEQVEFFLAGKHWLEVLDRPPADWLPRLLRALERAGVHRAGAALPGATSAGEVQATELKWTLEELWKLAGYTDQLWPVRASAAPPKARPFVQRGLGAAQESAEHGYRLGSQVRLKLESDKSRHLLLLDQGPEGILYCLCPSDFAPSTAVVRGQNEYPQAGARHDSFVLTGEPGREKLLAILSEKPLPLDWMPRGNGVPARVLSREDVKELLAVLRDLPAESWVALSTYFDVIS